MGIPKYYRWISERYPCLSEKIKDYQIPEFDNLYLDMNGIIHTCSHPNDEDIHLRISENSIFKTIFAYIEFLFKMIKPQKVFFMAVDGVAPRAKMNQQRGRRFRSARLAEEQEAEAIRKGEVLPTEDRFDSNCITPGTQFMAILQEHLKYFIQVKVSTDPLWQQKGLKIYLSGHDVPGEGEHKVMDFIRHIRSKPDYDPETRHCLYGLDADLIMLGLSTHELRFSLLREEVKFSTQKRDKRQKKPVAGPPVEIPDKCNVENAPFFHAKVINSTASDKVETHTQPNGSAPGATLVEGVHYVDVLKSKSSAQPNGQNQLPGGGHTTVELKNITEPNLDEKGNVRGGFRAPLPNKLTFFLLHLSLLRDYIDEEFQPLRRALEATSKLKYDLESIIDDWILMSILVGNDFVPHLPNLHITKGALPMLYQTYMKVIPSLGGYLNEYGILNLSRFEVFVKAVSQFDLEVFRETYDDMQYMESKTGKNIVLGDKMFQDFDFDENDFDEEALEPLSPELQALVARTNTSVYGESQNGGTLRCGAFSDDEEFFNHEDSPEMRLEFFQHKRDYYTSKIEVAELNKAALQHLAVEYVRAVQWVLLYYYKGVSSWGWYYPYHYAPFSSDLRTFGGINLQFEKGEPFKPFQQLLGVLPAQSKKLLPKCYQWLMTEKRSPIVEYYPEKFTQDLNGKKQDWEAVVLIPFIDEGQLLAAMEKESANLTDEEVRRNSRGVMLCYSYTKDECGVVIPPALTFPSLASSNAKLKTLDDLPYNAELLPKGIHPRAKIDTIYQGFPALKSISHESCLEKAEVKIFEFLSREESMIITMKSNELEEFDVNALAAKLIGKAIWVNWPHLTYVLISAVSSKEGKFLKDRDHVYRDNDSNEKSFYLTAKSLVEKHIKCKGIRLPDVNVMIWAKMMEGRKVRVDSRGKVLFDVQWSKVEQPFTLSTAIYDENVMETFYKDRRIAKSYTDLFPLEDQVFSIDETEFGNVGIVKGYNENTASVIVEFGTPLYEEENNLKHAAGIGPLDSQQFYPSYKAAGQCQVSSYVLGRLTGSLFISVEEKKVKKVSSPRKGKSSTEKENGNDSDESSEVSLEDFPPLPEKKKNVGLDLKFNKKNLEVRGYTRKKDQTWMYSLKAIQLVNEYVSRFSEFVKYMSSVDKNKESLQASEIFAEEPSKKIDEMIEWLEERGVRDLQRIPMNTNILDDDDIDRVWRYIIKDKFQDKIGTRRRMTIPARFLFKSTLNRGCADPISGVKFEILDRVVCVDRGASMYIGHRGTIVGMHHPDTNDSNPSDDAFKSTSSVNLVTLFVLCDPTPSVFDKSYFNSVTHLGSKPSISQKDADQMSSDLATLLRIKINDKKTEDDKEEVQKPKIVNLYPFQVINLSKNIYKKNNNNFVDNYNVQATRSAQNDGFNRKPNQEKFHPHVKILSRNQNALENGYQQLPKYGQQEKSNTKPIPPFNKKGKDNYLVQGKSTITSLCDLEGSILAKNKSKPVNVKEDAKLRPFNSATAQPVIKQNITLPPFSSAQLKPTPGIPQQPFEPSPIVTATRFNNTITENSPFYIFMRPQAHLQQTSVQPNIPANRRQPAPQMFYPLPQQHPQFPSNYSCRDKHHLNPFQPPPPPLNWVAPHQSNNRIQQHHQNRCPLPQRHHEPTASYGSYPNSSWGFVPLQVDRALAPNLTGNNTNKTRPEQACANSVVVQSEPLKSQPGPTMDRMVEKTAQQRNSRMAANFGNFN